jgi:hypothetical protein
LLFLVPFPPFRRIDLVLALSYPACFARPASYKLFLKIGSSDGISIASSGTSAQGIGCRPESIAGSFIAKTGLSIADNARVLASALFRAIFGRGCRGKPAIHKQNRMSLEEICSLVEGFIAAPELSLFDDLARAVFRFQFEQNTPYRSFCESRGVTPASLKSADEVPAIVTSAFKDLDLSVLPPSARTKVFYSSGTTAQRPSRHFHSARTLRVYEQSLLRWFKPNVLPDCPRADFLVLTPRAIESRHSSLVHMFETLSTSAAHFCATAVSDGTWSINFDQVLETAHKITSEKTPTVICGTAFSFVHLCDFLARTGQTFSFPPGSRVFETGGYKGRSRSVPKPELHQMISRHLSIPETHIVSEYGMSELSSQAYDRKPGDSENRIYRFPAWVRFSVISPETGRVVAEGETGLLRVLDLANVGSVMAIQTEDLALHRGDGFELLGRAALTEPRGCSLMNAQS